MDSEQVNLPIQIQELRQHQHEVVQVRTRMLQIREELRKLDEEQREQLDQLTARMDRGQDERLRTAQDEYSEQLLRIEADLQSALEAAERDSRELQSQQEAKFEQQQQEIRHHFDGELWVLRSVLDESREDSPISAASRARDALETLEKTIRQRCVDLEQCREELAAYLRSCHSGMDETVPPAEVSVPSADAARLRIQELYDQCFAETAAIYAMSLPQWVQGIRVLLIPLVLFLAVLVSVTFTKADPQSFVTAGRSEADWEWLGVSAVIAAATAFMVTMILVLIVKGRLSRGFEEILQAASNAAALETYWSRQSWKQQEQLEARAELWLKEMEQQRRRKAAALTKELLDQQAEARRQHTARMQTLAERRQQQLEQLHADSAAAVEEQERRRDQLFAAVRSETQQLTDTESERLQLQGGGRRQALMQEFSELRSAGESSLAAARLLMAMACDRKPQQSAVDGARGNWIVPADLPQVIEAGEILAEFPALPSSSQSEGMRLQLPALLRFPQDLSLVIRHQPSGRETSLEFVRSILIRILTSMVPGRLQFTLIDPVGLGQSFSALMHLADFDELMIGSRIWTESTQIRDRLQKVTEHMESVFQTYLRSEYETIQEYNEAAGEVAEPFHFVVIAGFPAGFTEESARHLTSILTSGPRCGVHTIMTLSPEQELPRSFNADDLRSSCVGFSVRGKQLVPDVLTEVNSSSTSDGSLLSWTPPTCPSSSEYVEQVRAVGEQSRDARRVEVSFTRVAPTEQDIWKHSAAAGIDLPMGRAGAARLQYLRLGRGTSQHVLIAGKTGSGKSTLMHILVTNMALMYSPDEVRFCLVDFKKGVEFRAYAACQLPHADVIAIESDREFGLSVLEKLDRVLQERGELFRERGVQDVPSFRRQYPVEPMPRLILLIDEFQEFFTIEDRVSAQASLLLDRLVRQGRAFGIHVVLGSQTLGGAYSLARSTLGQVAIRIALQCSENDAHLILSENNSAARLLTRPGEAIYNDANGMVEGNHLFQVAWLDDEHRDGLLRPLRQRVQDSGGQAAIPLVFEGNVPPRLEHCAPLAKWIRTGASADTPGVPLWLGDPVAIADPVRIDLDSAAGRNLLIVGQEAAAADAILSSALISAGSAPRTIRAVLIHDQRDPESLRQLSAVAAAVPGEVLVCGNADIADLIASLAAELAAREAMDSAADAQRIVLCVRNLGSFSSLRRKEDDFGFGGFGAEKVPETSDHFGDLIRRGPLVGIHVVIWADSFSNVVRWLSSGILKEFDARVAFRMNQTDSASLIDTAAASQNSPGRAILYRDATGETIRFRPWFQPTAEAVQLLNRDSGAAAAGVAEPADAEFADAEQSPAADELPNIDDLIIE